MSIETSVLVFATVMALLPLIRVAIGLSVMVVQDIKFKRMIKADL